MEEQTRTPEETNAPAAPSLASERLQIASVLLGISFIFLFAAIAQVILDLIICAAAPAIAAADWYPWVASSVPMYVLAMPASLLLFSMGRATPPRRGERLSLLVLLGLVAICFAVTYAGNLLGTLVNAIIGRITGEMPENTLESMTAAAPFWANLLFVGILAPIMEEIFFRKLVIDRLRRYGEIFALLVSGVIFGLVHGNFYQFFYAAAMGILFGYVYLRTGRLRYTVILHLAINLVGGVYTTEMMRLIDPDRLATDPIGAITASPAGALMLSLYLSFLVLCAVAAIVAVILLSLFWLRRYSPSPAERKFSRGEWVRVLLLNPALWIFLCFVFLLFV